MNNVIYLVTGAAGFLGSNICTQLLERGERVRTFVLEGDKAAKFLPERVEVFYGNLCDKASLLPFFSVEQGVKTICIHVASMVTVNPYYRKTVLDVNVGGTENIVDMCLEHKECEKKAEKIGQMPLMTTFSVYNLKRNNVFDYSKAINELGYRTRPMHQTLRNQIKWLKENNMI